MGFNLAFKELNVIQVRPRQGRLSILQVAVTLNTATLSNADNKSLTSYTKVSLTCVIDMSCVGCGLGRIYGGNWIGRIWR